MTDNIAEVIRRRKREIAKAQEQREKEQILASLVANVEQQLKAFQPVIRWKGDKISVNGVWSPSLSGKDGETRVVHDYKPLPKEYLAQIEGFSATQNEQAQVINDIAETVQEALKQLKTFAKNKGDVLHIAFADKNNRVSKKQTVISSQVGIALTSNEQPPQSYQDYFWIKFIRSSGGGISAAANDFSSRYIDTGGTVDADESDDRITFNITSDATLNLLLITDKTNPEGLYIKNSTKSTAAVSIAPLGGDTVENEEILRLLPGSGVNLFPNINTNDWEAN